MSEEAPQIPVLRRSGPDKGRSAGNRLESVMAAPAQKPAEEPVAEPLSYKNWEDDPDLVEAKFDQLIKELQDVDREIAELEARKTHARTEVERLVKEKPYGVRARGYQSVWRAPSFTLRLDKGRAVAAGVTPDQLDAMTVRSPKKGYLEIRKVKDGE